MGDEATAFLIRRCFETKKPMGQALHRKIMNDFRQYVLVGGMPQSVLAYLNGKGFQASDEAKRRILQLYRDDVSKFAAGYEEKVYAVFDGIPGQLSKKEKKYRLSSISKNARFRAYEDFFIWLNEAMGVNACFNATDPCVGLALSTDHATQKCYMVDTGLLITFDVHGPRLHGLRALPGDPVRQAGHQRRHAFGEHCGADAASERAQAVYLFQLGYRASGELLGDRLTDHGR